MTQEAEREKRRWQIADDVHAALWKADAEIERLSLALEGVIGAYMADLGERAMYEIASKAINESPYDAD